MTESSSSSSSNQPPTQPSINIGGSVGIVNSGNTVIKGDQIGVQHNYAPERSLTEAFAEIQSLWEEFAKQYDSPDEDKFAEQLAQKAKDDKTFRQKLGDWCKKVAGIGTGEAAKVFGGEIAKAAVPKALALMATLL